MTDHNGKSVAEVVSFFRGISKEVPCAAVVLGSGVNVLENLEDKKGFPYSEVFGVAPTVPGHSGSLTIGRIDGILIAVLRGRFHLFEGHDWDTVTLPTRAIIEWGIPRLFLTNAAGGINLDFRVGDLMLVTSFRDHLNPKLKETGLLPALSQPAQSAENEMTRNLVAVGEKLANSNGKSRTLRQGTYAGLLGPTYETIAEIQMLRKLKSDAVGMSTVPELKTAAGTKTTAAAISVITNVWTDDVVLEGHQEVLDAAKEASLRLESLLKVAIVSQ